LGRILGIRLLPGFVIRFRLGLLGLNVSVRHGLVQRRREPSEVLVVLFPGLNFHRQSIEGRIASFDELVELCSKVVDEGLR